MSANETKSYPSTTPRVLGLSRDQRTQRWQVQCPACGNVFVPETTMCSTQSMTCTKAKCGVELHANYNAEPPVVTVAGLARYRLRQAANMSRNMSSGEG